MHRYAMYAVLFFVFILPCGCAGADEPSPPLSESPKDTPRDGFVPPDTSRTYGDMNMYAATRYEEIEKRRASNGSDVVRSAYGEDGRLTRVEYEGGRAVDYSYALSSDGESIQECALVTKDLKSGKQITLRFIGSEDGQVKALEISEGPAQGAGEAEPEVPRKIAVPCDDATLPLEQIATQPIGKSRFFEDVKKTWEDAWQKLGEAKRGYDEAVGKYCDGIDEAVKRNKDALDAEGVSTSLIMSHFTGPDDAMKERSFAVKVEAIHEAVTAAIPPKVDAHAPEMATAALMETEHSLYSIVRGFEARCVEEFTATKSAIYQIIDDLQDCYAQGLVMTNGEEPTEAIVILPALSVHPDKE